MRGTSVFIVSRRPRDPHRNPQRRVRESGARKGYDPRSRPLPRTPPPVVSSSSISIPRRARQLCSAPARMPIPPAERMYTVRRARGIQGHFSGPVSWGVGATTFIGTRRPTRLRFKERSAEPCTDYVRRGVAGKSPPPAPLPRLSRAALVTVRRQAKDMSARGTRERVRAHGATRLDGR